jgi:hypothetical protein
MLRARWEALGGRSLTRFESEANIMTLQQYQNSRAQARLIGPHGMFMPRQADWIVGEEAGVGADQILPSLAWHRGFLICLW